MPITGGIVSFEQSRKLAEYENRKVSITFNVNESEGNSATEQVIGALALAQHHVFVALGLAKATDTPAAASIGAAEPEKKPATRKKPPAVVTVEPAKSAADAAEVVDDAPTQSGGANTASATGTSLDPAAVTDDSLFSPAATVTDAELLSQITRKNAALQVQIGDQAPPKIRALIGKYVTAPKQAKDIPQDQRAKFLEELAAITA